MPEPSSTAQVSAACVALVLTWPAVGFDREKAASVGMVMSTYKPPRLTHSQLQSNEPAMANRPPSNSPPRPMADSIRSQPLLADGLDAAVARVTNVVVICSPEGEATEER